MWKMIWVVVAVLMVGVVGGCARSGVPRLPEGQGSAPGLEAIDASLAAWPREAKRPFFATIRAAGSRITATGILDYRGARDFRITAVTELGAILFDARCNWAGAQVMRAMPGLDKGVVEALVRDMSLAMQQPMGGREVDVHGRRTQVKVMPADHHRYLYYFTTEADGTRLRRTEVKERAGDTLTAAFTKYDSRGWPVEMVLSRPARLYTVTLTFTDEAGGGNR